MGGNGGAIDGESNSVSIGSAGSTVIITGNMAAANGGAIFSQNNSVLVNGDVTLSNNSAMGGNGGAIDEESNNVSIGSADQPSSSPATRPQRMAAPSTVETLG